MTSQAVDALTSGPHPFFTNFPYGALMKKSRMKIGIAKEISVIISIE